MPIQVIAHRGASADQEENTPAALEEALRQGCDAIEVDVQLSRDGTPVLFHDRTLVRLGEAGRQVADLDLRELRRLGGARLATLEEILEQFGARTRLLIEVKTREGRRRQARHEQLMRSTVQAVEAAGLRRRVSILCFDAGLLQVCASVSPDLPRVLNVKPTPVLGRRVRQLLPGLAALSADIASLTQSYGRAVAAANCPLLVFTCNSRRRVAQARRAGAAGIMSDRPGWLVSELLARAAG